MTRYKANKLIMGRLQTYIKKNRGIRFNQMLVNLGITREYLDDFYTESEDVLKKLRRFK